MSTPEYEESPDYQRGFKDGYRQASREALLEARKLIDDLLAALDSDDNVELTEEEHEHMAKPIPIEDMGFEVRIMNMLHRIGIYQSRQLMQVTSKQLLNVIGCGPVTLQTIKSRMAEFNLRLADDE